MLQIKNKVTAYIHGGKTAEADNGNATLHEFLEKDTTPVDDGKLYPFHAFDAIKLETEESELPPVDDNTCLTGEPEPEPEPEEAPTFEGIDDVAVAFGGTFNPREGVTAKDGNGNDIAFEVDGEVDVNTPGEYTLTYTATDAWGKTTVITRKVTVENPTTAPTFSGLTDAEVRQGVVFDLADGVTATDAMGKSVDFSYDPTSVEKCEVGEQEITYTATDEWGNTATATRKITVTQIGNPAIDGLTELTVEVGEEFDPLDGVTAKDANGNDIEVEVVEEEPTDECELIAELGTSGSETSVIEKIALGDTPLIDGEFYNYTLTKAYDPEAGGQNAQDYEGQEQADSSYFDGAIALPVRIGETAGIFVVYDGNELYAVPDDNGLAFETFTLCKPR